MSDLPNIQNALTQVRARWAAKQTPLTDLDDVRRQRMLGVIDNPASRLASMARRSVESGLPSLPAAVDWRNFNGRNHITPVKDQGGCGSCVSFCTAATVEAAISIEHNQKLDLSEADLHFCSSHGESCGGWWPDDALESVKTRGLCDEERFPYAAAFSGGSPHCIVRPDRDANTYRIRRWNTVATMTERKSWLASVGPMCAVMAVYGDFFSYGSGVYHHTTGNLAGYHCVEVIGYSDAEGCWICKNSWGAAWGDSGFFKIAYGQCGIDDTSSGSDRFPFWGVRETVLPRQPIDWESLGGVLSSSPDVSSWGAGRLDVFGRGTDNALWHKWFDGTWHNWESLGGVLSSGPDVCSWASGRLDVFARGSDNALWHKWFDGTWHDWESLGGGLTSDPAAVSWGNGRIDVFARGTDNALWHKWFDGTWQNWESLGGVLSSGPDVSSWASGRLDVFVRGTDNALWHKWFDNGWQNWESLGGVLTSDPGAVSWGRGRVDVFVRGTDNALWHKWFDGSWSH